MGCGDGRINFHAIQFGVQQSIGLDIDEDIVSVGHERLSKIYPQPNLQLHVSDLMDPNSVAWKKETESSNDESATTRTEDGGDGDDGGYVSKATILTMYFATPGLEQIRPFVEQALAGKRCKIFTCGYAMPGWNSQYVETVLDIPIHFYDWGNPDVEDTFFVDPLFQTFPEDNDGKGDGGFMDGPSPTSTDRFLNQNKKKSTFQPDPLLGYHPDDLIDYKWDDFDDEDEEGNNDDSEKKDT